MRFKLFFFSKTVSCAVLNDAGKVPCKKETVESLHIIKAKMQENRFSEKMGFISKDDDLFGREVISLMILSIVRGGINKRFD